MILDISYPLGYLPPAFMNCSITYGLHLSNFKNFPQGDGGIQGMSGLPGSDGDPVCTISGMRFKA